MNIQEIKNKIIFYGKKILFILVIILIVILISYYNDISYYYKLYKIDKSIINLNKEENELYKRLTNLKLERKDLYNKKIFYVNDINTKIKIFCLNYLDNNKIEECKDLIYKGNYDEFKKFLNINQFNSNSFSGKIISK